MLVKNVRSIVAAVGLSAWAITGCSHSDPNAATPPPVQTQVQNSQLPPGQKAAVQAQILSAQQGADAQSKALSAQKH